MLMFLRLTNSFLVISVKAKVGLSFENKITTFALMIILSALLLIKVAS